MLLARMRRVAEPGAAAARGAPAASSGTVGWQRGDTWGQGHGWVQPWAHMGTRQYRYLLCVRTLSM